MAWLASQLELAAAGVVGIAGIVELHEAHIALADQLNHQHTRLNPFSQHVEQLTTGGGFNFLPDRLFAH